MIQNERARGLFSEALAGRVDRRTVMRRAAALGISAPVAAALARASARPARAAEEGNLEITYYQWILDLHSPITGINSEFNETFPLNAEVAPTQGFGFDRFVAEARDEMSTWDMYIGVTPFLEMIQLANSGVIEPWDSFLPEGLLESMIPAIREEGSYDGGFYVWPFLLDVIVQGWNASLVEAAGLDPAVAPTTWDEFIANAQAVQDSGVAPFGLTFDRNAWRSLIPITHSISTDVYDPDTGLFQWNSEPAVQALEIMKRMMPLANPDVLNPGQTDGGVNQTPDEQAFASQAVAYYIKYQNAHLRFAGAWPDPSQLQLSALPMVEGGDGGTVFWTTGAVLLSFGEDKEQAAQYLDALTHDQRVWEHSVTGAPPEETAVGQLPVYTTTWDEYEANRPEWLTDWAFDIYEGLSNASAIAPTRLAVTQFNVAGPYYWAYLAGDTDDAQAALDEAMAAVEAEYDALPPMGTPVA
ncbi:MAG: extracellular solute-binding protein [Chloroflexia bacterium]|nr:extracellular solute-binding protein [Chloroflexia bacterium]